MSNKSGFITEGEFLSYGDYIKESPNSFKKKKIIPTSKEEKEREKIVETENTDQDTQDTQNEDNNNNNDDSIEEIQDKEADELFETMEKNFYGKATSSVQQRNSIEILQISRRKRPRHSNF